MAGASRRATIAHMHAIELDRLIQRYGADRGIEDVTFTLRAVAGTWIIAAVVVAEMSRDVR